MELYYVADPMCSWCYGFALEWKRAKDQLALPVRLVMGGLASDSDEPMPAEMREYVQSAWRSVAQTTGAGFNHEFWERCTPRRSTYPSCRAVLAAEGMRAGAGEEIHARPFLLVTGRQWRGTALGGTRGRTQLPGMVDRYMRGRIKLDEMITATMPLVRCTSAR